MLTNFHADSKKGHFPAPPIFNILFQKFHGLVPGLVELIDAKDIDMAMSDIRSKTGKNCFFVFLGHF